jgi:pimeloyl-ACP methyl ester carboxylesterase
MDRTRGGPLVASRIRATAALDGVRHDRHPAVMIRPRQIPTPDGRSLDVYVSGPEDGPVLLFHDGSPGAGTPSARFLAATGERGLRYVAASRPGYGSSTRREGRNVADVAEDSVTVLDHLGAARCYTMGWSGGGPHTLACAALLPDRVIAATSVASVAPYAAEGLDFLAGMGEENIVEFGAAVGGSAQLQPLLEAQWPALRDVAPEAIADALGDLVPPVDRAALTGDLAESMAEDLHVALSEGIWGWHDDDLAFTQPWGFDLASIRVPLSIWQGEQDRMVPFAHGEWLAAALPSAHAHLLPEHGHLSLAVDSIGLILDAMLESVPTAR